MQLPILVRLFASAVAVALLVLEVGSAAYGADPTYPTGTFTVDRTSTYALAPDGDVLGSEPVVVTRRDVMDDTTAPDDIQIVLDPNDGASGSFLWSAPYCPGDTCSLGFSRVGTFTPHALLTDEDGHTTDRRSAAGHGDPRPHRPGRASHQATPTSPASDLRLAGAPRHGQRPRDRGPRGLRGRDPEASWPLVRLLRLRPPVAQGSAFRGRDLAGSRGLSRDPAGRSPRMAHAPHPRPDAWHVGGPHQRR